MSLFDKILEEHDEAIDQVLDKIDYTSVFHDFFRFHNGIMNAIDSYKETKDVAALLRAIPGNTFANTDVKENVEPNTASADPPTRRRSKRVTMQKPVAIKKERLSLAKIVEQPSTSVAEIKTESQEMPAPKVRAPRAKKTAKKNPVIKVTSAEDDRPSDIVLCPVEISTVSVVDNDEDDIVIAATPPSATHRMTRTKTRNQKEEKRARDPSSNDETQTSNKKKSKTDTVETPVHVIEAQEAEISTMDKTLTPKQVMNATVVLEKATVPQHIPEDLMTDDDSLEQSSENKASTFHIFSPSPVKLKIQRFETLQKNKPGTPVHNTFIPRAVNSSAQKPMRTLAKAFGNCTSTEHKALDERRREKEEAAKNREAIRQAELDEKKRRREERELKVQQQRIALDNEKKRQLAAANLKQQKEEAKKLLLLAKMKTAEKQVLEQNGEQKAMQEGAHEPIYMRSEAPLLPTDDCYDSDDESAAKATRTVRTGPVWYDVNKALRDGLLNQKQIKQQMLNSFFVRQTTTPDLTEVFEQIEPKKLKRTSSAVWHRPPRYTMIHNLDDYLE